MRLQSIDEIVATYARKTSVRKRILYVTIGWLFVAFAIIGIWVPGWPTVSWAVPAAYLFSISDERYFRWSLTNRYFGPALTEYYATGKTIPKHAKGWIIVFITIMSAISIWITTIAGDPGYGQASIAVVWVIGVWWLAFKVKSRGQSSFKLPRIANSENPLRLAVLISGSGSGMGALLNHQKTEGCIHKTAIVISNNRDAKGLTLASDANVKTEIIEFEKVPETTPELARQMHEKRIHLKLIENDIEAVILSGYMRILTPWFVEHWEGRLLNIHPSLLPKYPGAHAHVEVLKSEDKVTGCTVHFVDSGVDSGRIIAQREVPINEGDTIASLSERVKEVEHKLYPEVIDQFAAGQIQK